MKFKGNTIKLFSKDDMLRICASTVGKALVCHHARYGFESLLDFVLFVVKIFFSIFFLQSSFLRVRVKVRVRAGVGVGLYMVIYTI